MPKLEWLFLDLAAEGCLRLNMTWGNPIWFRDQWNLPSHGLSREEADRTLRDLHARNLIEWLDWDENGRSAVVPNLAETDLTRSTLAYGLTAQGGAEWEAIAQPDWNNLFDFEMTDPVDQIASATISGLDQRRLGFAALQFACNFHSCLPDFTRCELKSQQPYMPTYWKAFPIGHSLTFEVKALGADGIFTKELMDFQSVFDWPILGAGEWYDRRALWKSAIAGR